MIFANYIKYGDKARVIALRPEHRNYMFGLIEQGKVVAAGSFPDNTGGLYLYEVQSQEAAEKLMADDPFFLGDAIAEHRITCWEVHGANPALLQASKNSGS